MLTFPAMIPAWKTIQNQQRVLLFVFYVVGFVLENMIVKEHIHFDTMWGILNMVLLTEAWVYVGYSMMNGHLRQPGSSDADVIPRVVA